MTWVEWVCTCIPLILLAGLLANMVVTGKPGKSKGWGD